MTVKQKLFNSLFFLMASNLVASSVPLSTPAPPTLQAQAFVLIDAETGYLLTEKNATKRHEPASLAKLMTLLVAYEQIKEGYLKLSDQVQVSKTAWQVNGSKMFLREKQKVSVADLIKGIIIVSANDACIALAEHLAGSAQAFTQWMNEKAAQIHLQDTHFADPIGFSHPDTYSTAYDMALLARYLLKHYPEYYAMYKEKWFTFNDIKQPNRNRLLWHLPYVDGLKTGHTENAGYNLVASGQQAHMRLISATMQSPSEEARMTDHKQLLAYGFKFFSSKELYPAKQPITQAKLWYGVQNSVPVGFSYPVEVVCPTRQCNKLKTQLTLNQPLKAPIKQGDQVGLLQVYLDEQLIHQQPLIALAAIPECAMLKKMLQAMHLKLQQWLYA